MARFGKGIITLWPAPVRDEPGEIPGSFSLRGLSRLPSSLISRFLGKFLSSFLGLPGYGLFVDPEPVDWSTIFGHFERLAVGAAKLNSVTIG